jgi:hypothetical protein
VKAAVSGSSRRVPILIDHKTRIKAEILFVKRRENQDGVKRTHENADKNGMGAERDEQTIHDGFRFHGKPI